MKTILLVCTAVILLMQQSQCEKKTPVNENANPVYELPDIQGYDSITGVPFPNPKMIMVDTTFFLLQIDSLTRFIESEPEDRQQVAAAYSMRGDLRSFLRDFPNACSDWKKAKSLGYREVKSLYEKYCK